MSITVKKKVVAKRVATNSTEAEFQYGKVGGVGSLTLIITKGEYELFGSPAELQVTVQNVPA